MSKRAEKTKPTVGVTLGDPAGIGPEVALKAVRDPTVRAGARAVLLGPRVVVEHYARRLSMMRRLEFLHNLREATHLDRVLVLDTGHFDRRTIPFGRVDRECGRAAVEAIRQGVTLALAGQLDALATGPIHKKSAQLAGMVGAGHTEFIAHLCGARDVRLMLIGPKLRVIHATGHVSLRDAIGLIQQDRILRTIELGADMLERLGFARPRIVVAGLNPHASDEGLFGEEEKAEVAPAVQRARRGGFHVVGPVPPDTVFYRALRGEFDLVVAMYHDQGHIPAKTYGFEDAVNVTAGLPIVRTSVDHGTAFDLVGKNKANPQNMTAAIRLAARLGPRPPSD